MRRPAFWIRRIPSPAVGGNVRFRAMGWPVSSAYTLCMANYRLKVLGIPTAVILLCAAFVEAAFHLDQSVVLQLAGLVARLTIVIAFVYFVLAWRKTILAYW